ncbi:AAA family ATPase [Pseudonocardia sp. HH130630-07]|uniref:AAA family ATPase n=1 Tax=Pseudonocardia sp. HH130630-07 TaxID=1690815 RepID=UPI000839D674|nr:AAA family ATPase [Pseudonocardia sp. HH130630-07]
MYLVTGIQASGKSTVAEALARRLPEPAAHVHGDQFRRWVVTGRADMTPDAGGPAVQQLRLRHELTARTADGYAAAGFSVVVQDVVLGPHLDEMITALRTRPLHVVVLAPRPEVAAQRRADRDKTTSDAFTSAALDRVLRTETARRGLWLDSSDLDVDATVGQILARSAESIVGVPGVVREWNDSDGHGVVDSAATPGGCWVHFGAIVADGYRSLTPGGSVTLEWEPVRQDGFAFRGTRVVPHAPGTGSAYRSALDTRP